MPYPREHAARLQDPDKYVRFRRENDAFGPGIDAVWGISRDGQAEEIGRASCRERVYSDV